MANNRVISIFITVMLLVFGLPAVSFASQPVQGRGERVVPLSASGVDIANSIAYSADGKWLAVGSSAGVSIFDSQSLSLKQFIKMGVWVHSVTFSPDGETIAAGLFDGTARFLRLSDGKEMRVFNGHSGWVRSVKFSAEGGLFVSASDDDSIRIYDAASGDLKLAITGLKGVRTLALSPDGQLLAAGLQDRSIRLMKVTDGEFVRNLFGHKDWVRSLAFSPDGKTLASGAFDAKAILWDVASGQQKFTLDGHQSSVLDVVFAPDGKTLASGSVDSTVKLWNTANGQLLRTLVGHKDFVYSVAFSPDGKQIVSGSSDNSMRIWDLSDAAAGASPQADTPSDCRACHHPFGLNTPPRVIQVNCEACHAGGIVMNWCPFFPRSQKAVSEIAYLSPRYPIGVPISSENIAVRINYPTNGETLYVTGYSQSPVFVAGEVFFNGNMNDVKVRMQIWSDGQFSAELFTIPDHDGDFLFNLVTNPDGALIVAGAKAADPDCASCHEEFKGQASFPDGDVHFIITAGAPNGEQASDERWLTVDTSAKAQVDVRVVDQDSGAVIPGLSVHAAAILYEWRDVYANQASGADGIASLSLVTLSQVKTSYEINVPPTSLNGYLYESVEPVTMRLSPAASTHEPITIPVQVSRGQINGTLASVETLAAPLDIWAVHLPDGAFQKTAALDGSFSFTDLPSGEYLLFVDSAAGLSGFQATPQQVSLSKTAQADVNIALKRISTTAISGRMRAEDGTSLPFGWITAENAQTAQLDPTQGNYQLPGLEPKKTTLIAVVPGYYSQAQVVELSGQTAEPVDFSLVIRPETINRPWGAGWVRLPSETIYEESAGVISLKNGWVWGQNSQDEDLILQAAGMQIALPSGSFALEYSPAMGGWFYLMEGEASIQTVSGFRVLVRAGQMVALSDQYLPNPVAYQETVLAVLKQGRSSPLQNNWEPSLSAQLRDRLAQVGINVIQVVTFVTYMIVIVVLVVLVIWGIYSIWKYISKPLD